MPPLHSGLLRLAPERGEAVFAGKPLPLSESDVDLLYRLLERAGGFVAEEALAARPGPGTAAWLRERVSGINEVLAQHGDASHFVLHVPGLGYGVSLPGNPPALLEPLPNPSARLVGHQEVIAQLEAKAIQAPLLTIFGPGGIGKTTAAAEVARRLAPRHGDGVAFIDLAPLAQASSVPAAVAAALRMPAATGLRAGDLAAFLAPRQLLLVLDNCEHVVEIAAELCEAIQVHAPRCRVIATSREVLRCPGETVHRLPSLPTPAVGQAETAQAALRFAAVELFALRAADRLGQQFMLSDADAPTVAALCRRLDGLPLAIELAAALVGRFTLEGLAGLMETPHALQHDATPPTARHASLGHVLAWSYELLEPLERRVFERLAIFRSRFSLDSACVVAAGDGVDAAEVPSLVARLASKSLLAAQAGEGGPSCRLLETTRAFALERLQASGEYPAIARQHALHMRVLLRAANARRTELRSEWLGQHGSLIDDVRAALAWAYSAEGDVQIALRLTIDATPLGYQLTLWNEFFVLHEHAIARLEALQDVDPAVELQLRTLHGEFVGHKLGPVAAMKASYDAALRIARDLPDAQLAAKARDGAWMGTFMSGDYPKALALVQQCVMDARLSGDQIANVRADRMLAQNLHFMARHDEAAELASRLAHRPGPAQHRPGDSAIDPRVSARVVLARIAWLQGRPDQARDLIEEADRLSVFDVPGGRAHLIVWGALPLAVWRGEHARALQLLDDLQGRCATYQLPYWGTWIAGYAARLVPAHVPAGEFASHDLKHLDMLATFGDAPVPPATLARAEHGTAPWCAPEVLRAHAETLMQGNEPQWDEAERYLRRSYALARQQGVPGWELRSAISLARLWRHKGMVLEAGELLSGSYARFGEGWGTADLLSARHLLDQLRR